MTNIEETAKGIWDAFRRTWPVDRLRNLTLDDYYRKDSKDCFCKMLAATDKYLGSPGGRETKYGVWEYSNTTTYNHDNTYAWTGDCQTADEAFKRVKSAIVNIADAGARNDFKNIGKIDFAHGLKWKLAFMYQNADWESWKIYPVCARNWMESAAMTIEGSDAELQQRICERKDKFKQLTCYEFYLQLIEEKKYWDLIRANGQIILHGAPGTGKTYLAQTILAPMLTNGDLSHIRTIQFHPGYDYSDFVVGLKPKLINGQVSFEWRSGIFKAIADDAQKKLDDAAEAYEADTNPNKIFDPPKYVLVIDEINRADLSNVFGEVFSRMERGYRYGYEKDGNGHLKKKNEEGVELPSTKEASDGKIVHESLVVPDNLYIIGTMNDIDRSVESMDFALRRRFAWREIEAKTSRDAILDKFNFADQQKLLRAMTKLNEWITKDPENKLGKAYELGASIFAQLELYLESGQEKADDNAYKSLWENHIKIILTEYLRGQDFDGDKIKNLENAYLAAINDQDKDDKGSGTSKKSKKEKSSSDDDDGKGSDEDDKQVQ